MRELRERVVVITGAAGGIGRALAFAFARQGSALALVDLDRGRLDALREDLRSTSARASIHVADVGRRDALERVRDEVLAEHGRVDVLVNNAGVTIYAALDQTEPHELERIVAVNFMAVVLGCQVFLPVMRARASGHLVNVSSMAGFAGFPFQTLYCATKYAVRGLSEALRAELAGTGVRVTCVMPGTTATGIISSAASRDAALTSKMGGLLQRFGGSPDKLARRIVRGVRWNRFAVHGQLDSVLLDLAARTAPWLVRAMMAMMVRAARRRGWVGA